MSDDPTRTDRAEAIADEWIGADYSEASNLSKYLPNETRRNSLRAALITAALGGIASESNRVTTSTPTPDTLSEFARVLLGWREGVTEHISVGEARIIATLMTELGKPEVGATFLADVYNDEDEDLRDPLPWLAPNGSRHGTREKAQSAVEGRFAHHVAFSPRVDFDANGQEN